MLTETLERFGAPMAGSENVFNGGYQEISDLPMNLPEDLHPSSGSLGQDRPSHSHLNKTGRFKNIYGDIALG